MPTPKTAIVTGASQGIGAGLANAFDERGYNVVATSRQVSRRRSFRLPIGLAVVDGDIADPETAKALLRRRLRASARSTPWSTMPGSSSPRPFVDYTIEDYRKLAATNLEGFLHLTQLVVRQMLAQKTGGSIVSITTPLVDHPIAGVNASVAMMTKGGIEAHLQEHRDGICEGRNPRQHGRARRRRYAAAQGQSEGLPEDVVARCTAFPAFRKSSMRSSS